MTTCLTLDQGADLGPPAAGRMDGVDGQDGQDGEPCETVDLDYFLRRPRALSVEHWGVEGLGLFGPFRLRFALVPAGAAAPAAR